MEEFDREKLLEGMAAECELRGFSHRTRKLYCYIVGKFLDYCTLKRLCISISGVKSYLLSLKVSNNSSRIHHAALSFFFRTVLNQSFTIENVPLKKRYNALPKVIAQEKIKKIINSTSNVKHRLIIKILYSTGIRLQELVNLKREHIDFERNQVFVKRGKGNKDRVTLLSSSLKDDLLIYYAQTNFSTPYLFEGRKGKYSKKSVQKVLENKGKSIGIKITPHMLRHSFATHLLEAGTDIRYIQKLLGHANVETTQGYTYVSNVKMKNIANPLDKLIGGGNEHNTEKYLYKYVYIRYKFIYIGDIHMTSTQILETVGHSPTLNTVIMVEHTLKEAGELLTMAEIKRKLPKKIMHQTLVTILDYLQMSGKILIGTKGTLWIYTERKELDALIKKGTEV